MKTIGFWILNVVVITALCIVGYNFIAGDEPDEPEKSAPTTTTDPPPPSHEFVADGPNAERLRRLVDDLDLSAFLEGEYKGWQVGLVGELKGDSFSMMTGAYTDVFYASGGCDQGDGVPEEYFLTLLDPGDVVMWSTEGDDTNLCRGEVLLVEEK